MRCDPADTSQLNGYLNIFLASDEVNSWRGLHFNIFYVFISQIECVGLPAVAI